MSELADSIKRLRGYCAEGKFSKDIYEETFQTINQLVGLVAEMHEVSNNLKDMRSKCYIPNEGDWWDDLHESSLTKAAPIAALKE